MVGLRLIYLVKEIVAMMGLIKVDILKLLTSSMLAVVFFPVDIWGQDVNFTNFKKENVQITDTTVANFLTLVASNDAKVLNQALLAIDKNWKEAHEIMLVEAIYVIQRKDLSKKLVHLLQRKTGKKYDYDFDAWYQWIWNKQPAYSDNYYAFKAQLYQRMDPRFHAYFYDRQNQSAIRLDEVRWGGVVQDGIPPLRNPKMIAADKADYLNDTDVVFGIEVNGDFRAYPKRILAWHEMFVDTVGGTSVAGVYCTLCGTVILYETEHKGVDYQLGTSGFLYRSNKLMYDKATQSLWSTLKGMPVIGPLVGKDVQLVYRSVVTTTWGEWKQRHPKATVLSLETGYRRDYGEGVAYRDYFATDELMFTVPKIDKSLKNKDEVLAMRFPRKMDENLAIASKFLRKNPVYQSKIGEVPFVVFTDRSGAHRAYSATGTRFMAYDLKRTAKSFDGLKWTLFEDKLISDTGEVLKRIPTHNAFWFGYKAAFPEVKLVR